MTQLIAIRTWHEREKFEFAFDDRSTLPPEMLANVHETGVGQLVGATMARFEQLFHEILTDGMDLLEMDEPVVLSIADELDGDFSQSTEEKGDLFDRSPTAHQQHLRGHLTFGRLFAGLLAN